MFLVDERIAPASLLATAQQASASQKGILLSGHPHRASHAGLGEDTDELEESGMAVCQSSQRTFDRVSSFMDL